jgi:hypothetical protein
MRAQELLADLPKVEPGQESIGRPGSPGYSGQGLFHEGNSAGFWRRSLHPTQVAFKSLGEECTIRAIDPVKAIERVWQRQDDFMQLDGRKL